MQNRPFVCFNVTECHVLYIVFEGWFCTRGPGQHWRQ